MRQGFPNSGNEGGGGGGGGSKFLHWGEESKILLGEYFLPGEENLRRSHFDNSKLFQS